MKGRVLLLALVVVMIITTVQAAETNFSTSSLTAKDVNCKKCHIDTPHIIHAPKSVNCENCHGDKLSVSIPQCTKCHGGPDASIHKVHADKIEKGCEYCHKNIVSVHTNFTSEAVCSHCHKDIVEVHGKNQSCIKCHKAPPEIVKPLKSKEMILVCQNCHPQTSVATIHGEINEKKGCYDCHKGRSDLNGSEVPHIIHQTKASCKDCHEDNGKVVVPQCTKCHNIDELHAFGKIGKLTSGLNCQVCHPGETKPVEITKTAKEVTENKTIADSKETNIIPKSQQKEEEPAKVPGFGIISGIVILYIIRKMYRHKRR